MGLVVIVIFLRGRCFSPLGGGVGFEVAQYCHSLLEVSVGEFECSFARTSDWGQVERPGSDPGLTVLTRDNA